MSTRPFLLLREIWFEYLSAYPSLLHIKNHAGPNLCQAIHLALQPLHPAFVVALTLPQYLLLFAQMIQSNSAIRGRPVMRTLPVAALKRERSLYFDCYMKTSFIKITY